MALFLVLSALALPLAHAQTEPPERAASLLLYHVSPDPRAGSPDADPLSAAPSPPTQRLPYTLVDGIEATDPAPEGRPESALAHFREMQDAVNVRRATGASVHLALFANFTAEGLAVSALPDLAPDARPQPARARLILFDAGYLVRAAEPLGNVSWGAPHERAFALDPTWDRARLGVVAVVETPEGAALQSATWIAGGGPTRSVSKMVLVEHVTASWCEPCAPADEAFALLASQIGVAEAAAGARESYLRPATPLLVVGLLAGAAIGVALVRRRAP